MRAAVRAAQEGLAAGQRAHGSFSRSHRTHGKVVIGLLSLATCK